MGCAGRRLRKRLTHARPADPKRRPAPAGDFLAPQPLLPGILMAWDFCNTYRALLRLPPFPLSRLEMAFVDEAPADITFPLGSCGEATPAASAPARPESAANGGTLPAPDAASRPQSAATAPGQAPPAGGPSPSPTPPPLSVAAGGAGGLLCGPCSSD